MLDSSNLPAELQDKVYRPGKDESYYVEVGKGTSNTVARNVEVEETEIEPD